MVIELFNWLVGGGCKSLKMKPGLEEAQGDLVYQKMAPAGLMRLMVLARKWTWLFIWQGQVSISLYLCLFGRSQRLHYGICCVCVWRRKSEKLRSRRDGRGDGRPLCFVFSCFGWLGDFGRG